MGMDWRSRWDTSIEMTLTVTVVDNVDGSSQTAEVLDDDYFILTTGSCYVHYTQVYPKTGTHILTIKGQRVKREQPVG